MRALFFSICLAVAPAFAYYFDDAMDFKISSHGKAGCLFLDEVWARLGFTFPQGQVRVIRILYSAVSPNAVSESSEHFELFLSEDETSLDPHGELCGLRSGLRYYFKGQFLTRERKSLFLMPDSSYNPDRHSAIVP